jgi:hypothetical protein
VRHEGRSEAADRREHCVDPLSWAVGGAKVTDESVPCGALLELVPTFAGKLQGEVGGDHLGLRERP